LNLLLSKYPSSKFVACKINLNNDEKPFTACRATRVNCQK